MNKENVVLFISNYPIISRVTVYSSGFLGKVILLISNKLSSVVFFKESLQFKDLKLPLLELRCFYFPCVLKQT